MESRLFCAPLLIALLAPASPAQQPVLEIASVDSAGNIGNNSSFSPSISRDGRLVVFSSFSTNLVAGDTNFFPDVFVHDRASGQMIRASVDSSGAQANWVSWMPAMSGDGRVVAFLSLATNLVPNDTNLTFDAFVRDLQTGTTERVSVSTSGTEGNAATTFLAVSDDGSVVAFDGGSDNIVAADTNGASDVFLRDRQSSQTTRVSVGPAGLQGDGPSYQPSLSGNGRFVAFTSGATNLVTGDGNGALDVFVHDRLTGSTTRISTDSSGVEGDGDSSLPSFSNDGRFVAFESLASNLVQNDTNAVSDVFVRDLQTGATTRVSIGSSGAEADQGSNGASISSDGRFLTFFSLSTSLHPSAVAGWSNVFRRDLQMGRTDLISSDSLGAEAAGNSFVASISQDGRIVAFESDATSLVAGDTNAKGDIYVRVETAPQLVAGCFGDGSGTACPCGNSSPQGSVQGCLHSFGTGGRLAASGVASVANDSVVLAGSTMPQSSALYFQGTSQIAGGAGVAFGDGKRCAGGPIVRLGVKINSGGASQYPAASEPALSVRGACQPGSFHVYQVWFRNSAPFCTASTFNLTNTVQLTWAP